MAKAAKKKKTTKELSPKKTKGIQHKASFEELMKLAANTPKKKKK